MKMRREGGRKEGREGGRKNEDEEGGREVGESSLTCSATCSLLFLGGPDRPVETGQWSQLQLH